MSGPYLEITFRKGRVFAAYLYLPRPAGAVVDASRELRPGLVVDFGSDGKALGVEIVDPGAIPTEQILEVLREVDAGPLSPEELAPLHAA